MTKAEQKKLLATNAIIWTGATFASFVLPLIADSLAENGSEFLKVFLHTGVLITGMTMSMVTISKALGKPIDA